MQSSAAGSGRPEPGHRPGQPLPLADEPAPDGGRGGPRQPAARVRALLDDDLGGPDLDPDAGPDLAAPEPLLPARHGEARSTFLKLFDSANATPATAAPRASSRSRRWRWRTARSRSRSRGCWRAELSTREVEPGPAARSAPSSPPPSSASSAAPPTADERTACETLPRPSRRPGSPTRRDSTPFASGPAVRGHARRRPARSGPARTWSTCCSTTTTS